MYVCMYVSMYVCMYVCIVYWQESERGVSEQVRFVSKSNWRFGVVAVVKPQEKFAIFTVIQACKQCFQHLTYSKIVT